MLPTTLMSRADLQELTQGMAPVVADQLWARYVWQGVNLTTRLPSGELVACGGLQLFWPGVAEAWIEGTPLLRRYRYSLYYTLRHWFTVQRAALQLWRVQCAIVADHAEGCRLVEHLGFVREGVMARFDPQGRDAALYAWVRKEGA